MLTPFLALALSAASLTSPAQQPASQIAVAALLEQADGAWSPNPDFLAAAAGLPRLEALPVEVPGFGPLELDLERVPSPRIDHLLVDGIDTGPLSATLDPLDSLWRGTVRGDSASHVFLALSRTGSRGWVHSGGQTVHLLAASAAADGAQRFSSRWMDERELQGFAPSAQQRCQMLTPPGGAPSVLPGPQTPLSPAPLAVGLPLYECELVLESDFSFYSLFGNVSAATSYANALLGAIDATYRDQVGCVLTVSQFGLYTSEAADPFKTNSAGGLLEEMRQRWIGGLKQLGDLGHVISAAPDGGVAYLNVLCNGDYGVGASCSLGGAVPFPVVQGPFNWDFVVVAHELGHNFSTPHTHDYCPPLDQCAPNGYFGGCQTTQVCQQSTIMSYCHLCSGGIANIAPGFHPTVQQTMRNGILNSCLKPWQAPPQPPMISSVSPTSLAAVVVDGPAIVALTGAGFSGTTAVRVEGVALFDFPPQYSVVNDDHLTLQFPTGIPVGLRTIEVETPLGLTSTQILVGFNGSPTLELAYSDPSFIVQVLGLDLYVGGSFGDTTFLVGSTSLAPSLLPGIADFGLGNNLAELYYLGSLPIPIQVGFAHYDLPLSGNLPTGIKLHFQAGLLRFLNPTLPLQMTNVQSGTILF